MRRHYLADVTEKPSSARRYLEGMPEAKTPTLVVIPTVSEDVAPNDAPPSIDAEDPRLDAFVEALACALVEDLTSSPQP